MFGPLKEVLRGRRYATDNALQDALIMWLRSQPDTSSQVASEGFVNRYAMFVS
jgi:hypothetical protein